MIKYFVKKELHILQIIYVTSVPKITLISSWFVILDVVQSCDLYNGVNGIICIEPR